MEKFKQKYRIPTARLQNWDYGSPGLYFVTICAKDRASYFGNVETQYFASPKNEGPKNPLIDEAQNTETQNISSHNNTTTQNIASLRTEIGDIANQYWQEIPKHFAFVELDEYVIMPNHIHGILFINKREYDNWKPNKFGPQSQNLASVIRGYKAGVKAFATAQKIEFAWQPRFYDRIVRSQNELNNIRRYIISNPINWHLDKDNPEGLLM